MVAETRLLHIQNFLKGFHKIETAHLFIKSKFNIDVTEDSLLLEDGTIIPVWLYNYTVDKTNNRSSIGREARGLILDADHNIVSLSFKRFFDHTSRNADKLNWEATNIEFKHDGTLMVLYSYNGNYFFQTRRRANADGYLPGCHNVTYDRAARMVLKRLEFDGDIFHIFREHNTNDQYTWAFEYVSEANQHVTPYEGHDLVLLAIFDKSNIREVDASLVDQFAYRHGISRPPYHYAKDMKAVKKLVGNMNCMEEGVVLVDNLNHRVKVKNPSYRAIHKAATNPVEELSPKVFAEMTLYGDPKEISKHFPRFEPILNLFNAVLTELMEELQTIWLLYRIADDRKTFADNIIHHPFSNILFNIWDGKIKDMTDAAKYIKPKQLVALVTKLYPKSLKTEFERATTVEEEAR